MSTKVSIALEVKSTINNLIADYLAHYVEYKEFCSLGVINGRYTDAEDDILFKIPDCSILFEKRKIKAICLPYTVNFESELMSSSDLARKLESANIVIPFNLIEYVSSAQINNIEIIISNNIEALNLKALSSEEIKLLSTVVGYRTTPTVSFTLLEETTDNYTVGVQIEIGCCVFKSKVNHSKTQVTPYQTIFADAWHSESIEGVNVLQWIKTNNPELLMSTEALDRPLSSLHYMIKEYLTYSHH